ncbi:hypothetical protein [Paenibacillus pabuli]|uniref:hypothetical protein n=1 Tax=Paenibacillus pabuli TaxID=1472 RepID=UPI001FFF200C|nr:hypothetical protein [Paenibacillus pabuli]UPK41680.1 hypothetical protein KET34_20820 [Paenibacillus pabuli]
MLMVAASATGRYLFGASPFTNGKNIVVDLVEDNNGTLYQLVNEMVMFGPNSTRWRITIDANGDLKKTSYSYCKVFVRKLLKYPMINQRVI